VGPSLGKHKISSFWAKLSAFQVRGGKNGGKHGGGSPYKIILNYCI